MVLLEFGVDAPRFGELVFEDDDPARGLDHRRKLVTGRVELGRVDHLSQRPDVVEPGWEIMGLKRRQGHRSTTELEPSTGTRRHR